MCAWTWREFSALSLDAGRSVTRSPNRRFELGIRSQIVDGYKERLRTHPNLYTSPERLDCNLLVLTAWLKIFSYFNYGDYCRRHLLMCESNFVVMAAQISRYCRNGFGAAIDTNCHDACVNGGRAQSFLVERRLEETCKGAINETPRPLCHESCVHGYRSGLREMSGKLLSRIDEVWMRDPSETLSLIFYFNKLFTRRSFILLLQGGGGGLELNFQYCLNPSFWSIYVRLHNDHSTLWYNWSDRHTSADHSFDSQIASIIIG